MSRPGMATTWRASRQPRLLAKRSHVELQRAVLERATKELAGLAGPRSFSEDALQSAAAELLVSLPHRPEYCCLHGGSTPSVEGARGILYRRARSRHIDDYRSDARRQLLPLDAIEGADQRALADDVTEHVAATEWRRAVERALPARHSAGWAAWVMKAEAGLDATQIADASGATPATVRKRLSRSASWIRSNVPPDS